MTEREKMISGELYNPTDKELEQFLISPAWMSADLCVSGTAYILVQV